MCTLRRKAFLACAPHVQDACLPKGRRTWPSKSLTACWPTCIENCVFPWVAGGLLSIEMVSSAKPVHTVTNMPMFFFSTFIGLAGASHITANCKVSHGACAQDSLHQGSPSWLHHSDLKTLECESCQIDLFGCFFHRKMPASESHHPMFWTQAMDIRPKNVLRRFLKYVPSCTLWLSCSCE